MDKRDFAFDKVNYILLAVGMAVVVLGFLLMSGSGSTETAYDHLQCPPHQGGSAGMLGRFRVNDLCGGTPP